MTTIRSLTLCVILGILSSPAMADPVADTFPKQVDLVEHDLVGLARAMPADAYDFRPTNGAFEGVRTFGEQVKHAATMIFMTAALVLQEKSPYGPGPNDNGPSDVQGKEADCRLPGGCRSDTRARRWRR